MDSTATVAEETPSCQPIRMTIIVKNQEAIYKNRNEKLHITQPLTSEIMYTNEQFRMTQYEAERTRSHTKILQTILNLDLSRFQGKSHTHLMTTILPIGPSPEESIFPKTMQFNFSIEFHNTVTDYDKELT